MTTKRFTTMELPKPTEWGIWYDGAYLSTYQVCTLLNEYVDVKKEFQEFKIMCNAVAEELSLANRDNDAIEKENEELRIKLERTEDARKSYKEDWKACSAYCDEYKNEIHDLKDNVNGLLEENKQLKSDIKLIEERADKVYDENEQLKQRNDRQAKQLDRLYHLIEEKDWRALNDILDDFKRCEEQLQRELGTYGDFE